MLPAGESAGLIETQPIPAFSASRFLSYRRANPPASLKLVAHQSVEQRLGVGYRRANPPASLKHRLGDQRAHDQQQLPAGESAGLIETPRR